jgi:hypothetical protein
MYRAVSFDNIIIQIGWVTMDNASNNTTMMAAFTALLRARSIRFDHHKRHIQYGTSDMELTLN